MENNVYANFNIPPGSINQLKSLLECRPFLIGAGGDRFNYSDDLLGTTRGSCANRGCGTEFFAAVRKPAALLQTLQIVYLDLDA